MLLTAFFFSAGFLIAQRRPDCDQRTYPDAWRDRDLTRWEKRDLRRDAMDLNRYVRQASADGRINRREARRIRQMDAALDRKTARYQCNPHTRRHR
jgi:hypothetical protein